MFNEKLSTNKTQTLSFMSRAKNLIKLTNVLLIGIITVSLPVVHSAPVVTMGNNQSKLENNLLPNFSMTNNRQDKIVAFIKNDGTAKVFIQIMPAAAHLSTTKSYAQNVMDSYAGWGLTAQIERRGFSFKYVDNAPCSGLVSYFDGTSYLMMGACGFISEDELIKALFLAKKELKIEESLYRSSKSSSF